MSTGGGAGRRPTRSAWRRSRSAPEIASFDCGSLNFGERVFINSPEFLRELAARMEPHGVLPEIECFEPGHVANATAPDRGRAARAALLVPVRPRRPRRRAGGRSSSSFTWSRCCRRAPTGPSAPSAAPNCRWAWRRWRWAGTSAPGSKTTSTIARGSSPRATPSSSPVLARIAGELGRPLATPEQVRALLDLRGIPVLTVALAAGPGLIHDGFASPPPRSRTRPTSSAPSRPISPPSRRPACNRRRESSRPTAARTPRSAVSSPARRPRVSTWSRSSPSGQRPPVWSPGTRLHRLAGLLADGLRRALAAGPLDGVLLALHGAMVTEIDDDGEGYILDLARGSSGRPCRSSPPWTCTPTSRPRMVDLADVLIGYDTYPHIDRLTAPARLRGVLARLISARSIPPRRCASRRCCRPRSG